MAARDEGTPAELRVLRSPHHGDRRTPAELAAIDSVEALHVPNSTFSTICHVATLAMYGLRAATTATARATQCPLANTPLSCALRSRRRSRQRTRSPAPAG
ncbi:hypothetical protein AB1Y20_011929 [Prymnesium parvum]|uniref:Uncharacterized protein n=1 Tax=Prymnesium parvum TaxID=97485 RepID=A0AB34IPE9_PRYPA